MSEGFVRSESTSDRSPRDPLHDLPFHFSLWKVSSIRLETGQNRRARWRRRWPGYKGRKGRTQLIPVLGLYYISWLRYQASQQPTSRLSAFVPIHLLPITAPSRPGYAAQSRPLIAVPHFHPYSPISSPFPSPFRLVPLSNPLAAAVWLDSFGSTSLDSSRHSVT